MRQGNDKRNGNDACCIDILLLCLLISHRIMTDRKTGLIVNISSGGGLRYLFNVAYGIGKAACDRMAADCAIELKNDNVTMVGRIMYNILTM